MTDYFLSLGLEGVEREGAPFLAFASWAVSRLMDFKDVDQHEIVISYLVLHRFQPIP